MSGIIIFVEGGGDTTNSKVRCREGFTRLFEKSGFEGRLPRVLPCGSRNDAFDAFQTAHRQSTLTYVALLVDSEDPINNDIEQTWKHLKTRDGWERPAGATDDQVLLMTTCMETWIVADRVALNRLYPNCLQPSALPAETNSEQRNRHAVQDALVNATKDCKNAYANNKRSFEALANVDPATLKANLPSFARMLRILNEKL